MFSGHLLFAPSCTDTSTTASQRRLFTSHLSAISTYCSGQNTTHEPTRVKRPMETFKTHLVLFAFAICCKGHSALHCTRRPWPVGICAHSLCRRSRLQLCTVSESDAAGCRHETTKQVVQCYCRGHGMARTRMSMIIQVMRSDQIESSKCSDVQMFRCATRLVLLFCNPIYLRLGSDYSPCPAIILF